MAGYLEDYGSEDRRYEKLLKLFIIVVVGAMILWGLHFLFYDVLAARSRVSGFFDLLSQGEYGEAYTYWGCSVDEPCRNYNFSKFQEDWGPEGLSGIVTSYETLKVYEEDTGMIVIYTVNGKRGPTLWVAKGTGQIGFSPVNPVWPRE